MQDLSQTRHGRRQLFALAGLAAFALVVLRFYIVPALCQHFASSCTLVVPKTARGKALTLSLKGKTTVSTDAGDVSTNFAKSLKLTVH